MTFIRLTEEPSGKLWILRIANIVHAETVGDRVRVFFNIPGDRAGTVKGDQDHIFVAETIDEILERLNAGERGER